VQNFKNEVQAVSSDIPVASATSPKHQPLPKIRKAPRSFNSIGTELLPEASLSPTPNSFFSFATKHKN
jgi:hypothetical protein